MVKLKRKHYAKPGTTWIPIADAAALMGCHRTTAYRQLREYVVKRLHNGKRKDCVLLSRIRQAAISAVEDPSQTPPDIREIRAQIATLRQGQRRLAKAIGALSRHLGVRV